MFIASTKHTITKSFSPENFVLVKMRILKCLSERILILGLLINVNSIRYFSVQMGGWVKILLARVLMNFCLSLGLDPTLTLRVAHVCLLPKNASKRGKLCKN